MQGGAGDDAGPGLGPAMALSSLAKKAVSVATCCLLEATRVVMMALSFVAAFANFGECDFDGQIGCWLSGDGCDIDMSK